MKLTIGMATYNEYDGVYFTVQAIRLYHPEVTDETEIIILDNHPTGQDSPRLRDLADRVPQCRYVPYSDFTGTAVRDALFRLALSPLVLVMDSHVLVAPGALKRLIDYGEAYPDSRDLLQGPILSDDHHHLDTHWTPLPDLLDGFPGTWAADERGLDIEADPFEIPLMGLGLFACRREAWPGFHPLFREFGGEEGYIHEKIRRNGGRTLCLPFLRWMHRFGPRRGGYPNTSQAHVRNYLLGYLELGMDFAPIHRYFVGNGYIKEDEFAAIVREAQDAFPSSVEEP